MVLGTFLSVKFMPETLGKPMTETFEEFTKLYLTEPQVNHEEQEELIEKVNGTKTTLKADDLPESDI